MHWFDRRSGTHILFDEVIPAASTWSAAPRTLSVALSNVCDLGCHFCYRPKTNHSLAPEFVKEVVAEIDRLGALEVSFGGGEPLLYPHLVSLCQWVWANTSLGISLTTHGHRLSPKMVQSLKGALSSMRFSIDGGEPYYSQIRGRPLSTLLEIVRSMEGAIPFGINTVVSPGHVEELRRVAELAITLGAFDLLIIPEHRDGTILLSPQECLEIEAVIKEYRTRCRLSVTYRACAHLSIGTLECEREDEFVFAHLSADKMLKTESYERAGIPIRDPGKMRDYFSQLQTQGRRNLTRLEQTSGALAT